MCQPPTRFALRLACLVAGLLTRAATAEAPPLPVEWSIENDTLAATVDLSTQVGETLREAFESGFTNRLILSVGLWEANADGAAVGAPLLVRVRRCRVVYDLWAERFEVHLSLGRQSEARTLTTYAAAARACLRFDHLPLVPMGRLDLRRRYVLQARLDVNPRDPELTAQTAEYLGDPLGYRREGDAGGTLIGTVAKIFFRSTAEEADPGLRLRSTPLDGRALEALLAAAHRRGEQEEE